MSTEKKHTHTQTTVHRHTLLLRWADLATGRERQLTTARANRWLNQWQRGILGTGSRV